jgi:hypothetical protein
MAKQDRVFSRTPAQVEQKAATKASLKKAEKETAQLAEGWNLSVQNGHVESTIKLTIGEKTINAVIRFDGVLTDVVLDEYAKKEDLSQAIEEGILAAKENGILFTEEEKQAIVDEVIAALPVYDGGVAGIYNGEVVYE